MSGRRYDRAKYISNNAPDEIVEELNKGRRSIRGTYDVYRRDGIIENLKARLESAEARVRELEGKYCPNGE